MTATIDALTLRPDVVILLLVMAAAAALCRYSGFWFMRFIPVTPRIRASLAAVPLAVMIGIVLPPAMRGGIPEICGLAASMTVAYFRVNDLVVIAAGMLTVAALRASGL